MLTTWYTASFPNKPPLPGFRYKQTAVTPINAGSAILDGQGYITGANIAYDRLGSALYANFTVQPAKGDIFAISMTRTINPDGGTSTNVYWGSGQSIVSSFYLNSNLFFQGVAYPIGALTANKIDISYVLDFTAKTVKLLYSTTVGGAKTLLAEKPFQTVVASNDIRLYWDNSPSAASNILAYNNAEFAL
ncbi:hypothetical protein D3C73_954500 [compost metagenome]